MKKKQLKKKVKELQEVNAELIKTVQHQQGIINDLRQSIVFKIDKQIKHLNTNRIIRNFDLNDQSDESMSN